MEGEAMSYISKFIVLSVLLVTGASASPGARAYEYKLQYTPVGDYENLVVAGYQIVGRTIVGNCSYTAITSGSGRDPSETPPCAAKFAMHTNAERTPANGRASMTCLKLRPVGPVAERGSLLFPALYSAFNVTAVWGAIAPRGC